MANFTLFVLGKIRAPGIVVKYARYEVFLPYKSKGTRQNFNERDVKYGFVTLKINVAFSPLKNQFLQ
jgi:hypothetical protein